MNNYEVIEICENIRTEKIARDVIENFAEGWFSLDDPISLIRFYDWYDKADGIIAVNQMVNSGFLEYTQIDNDESSSGKVIPAVVLTAKGMIAVQEKIEQIQIKEKGQEKKKLTRTGWFKNVFG